MPFFRSKNPAGKSSSLTIHAGNPLKITAITSSIEAKLIPFFLSCKKLINPPYALPSAFIKKLVEYGLVYSVLLVSIKRSLSQKWELKTKEKLQKINTYSTLLHSLCNTKL
jgi:hypothetical protein